LPANVVLVLLFGAMRSVRAHEQRFSRFLLVLGRALRLRRIVGACYRFLGLGFFAIMSSIARGGLTDGTSAPV
jgi:hypothetical protein